MLIKVLGTRGEVKSSAAGYECHSGLLIDGIILMDVGEKSFLDVKPEAVFITHLHPDHAFFVTDPGRITVEVYAPEASKNLPEQHIIHETVRIRNYSVTPVPTHHSKKVKSNAYLVEHESEKLLYTGDMIWINKEYHHLLDGLSLVVTEASYLRKGGMVRKDRDTGQLYGHTGVPDLIRLFRQFTNHLLFMHYGNWFFGDIALSRQKLVGLGNEAGITVYPGYDGMELDLGELIDSRQDESKKGRKS